MLRGKERKNRYAKLNRSKEDLYALKINYKGERTVGKANKGINVEKIIGLKNLKKRKEKKKWKTPQNCKSPTQRQRFVAIKKVITKSLIGFHSANKINNYNRG